MVRCSIICILPSLLLGLWGSGAFALSTCDELLLKTDAEYEAKFTKKPGELAPSDFSGISRMAQGRDLPANVVNQEADKLSTQLLSDLGGSSAANVRHILELNRVGKVPVYEVGVVGASGVHGGELMTAIQALDPSVSVVGFDAGDGVHQTFDSDFFHLNSSNGPELDDTPLLYGPNQLRDLMPEVDGHVYPRARALANGNHNEIAALDADLLMKQNVVLAVRDPDGYFTITTQDGIRVRVRKLVAAVGYGPTKTSFMDVESQALVKESIDEFQQGKTRGLAISFDDLRRQNETDRLKEVALAAKEGRAPREDFDHRLDGLEKIVVGGGDGGAVVVEHEKKGKVLWLGQQGQTGADYIASVKNKKRYGDLVDRVDKGDVQNYPGHLTSVRRVLVGNQSKIEATYTSPDGNTEKLVGDILILASGYDAVPNVFGDMIPHYFANDYDPELKGVWDLARAREKEFYEVKHPELAGKQTPGFYSVGVYGFKATGMPSVAPGTGVTIQIAKELVSDVQIRRSVVSMAEAEGSKTQLSIKLSDIETRNIAAPKIALAGARVELLKEAREFLFPEELKISVKWSGQNITLEIDDVKSEQANQLLKKLSMNGAFLSYLKDARGNLGSLSLEIPVTPGGGLRMDKAKTVMGPTL